MLNEEADGITYAMQYLSKDMATYEKYQAEFAPELQQKYKDRYDGKFAAFRTLLEVVDHSTI